MSSTPPPPSDQPSDQPSQQAYQPRPDPRRRLVGVGFAILGGYFAYGVWQVEMSGWLKALLLAVFAGVAVYGVVQLLQSRRR
ncbi:hypothetical protein [Quadrisphaera setariae]|uniref:Uncharacterized protein n=1 Tax=Quadrisphaera setariae TaxID=2593304 RepID=A0A5C8ZKF3_9ACTN|nr:hypothetical protein [Quadrisphaera setariae]TXR57340.1 hypothetical protein FMM08_03485 [Quadrisphaera setariae]